MSTTLRYANNENGFSHGKSDPVELVVTTQQEPLNLVRVSIVIINNNTIISINTIKIINTISIIIMIVIIIMCGGYSYGGFSCN